MRTPTLDRWLPGALILLLAGCGAEQSAPMSAPMEPEEQQADDWGGMKEKSAPSPAAAAPAAPSGGRAARNMDQPDRFVDLTLAAEGKDEAPTDSAERGEAAPATRAWFPETFLFAPLVQTDDQGLAQVPVTVPDRLTTWRVLALAHDRQGHQAGAVTSFQGTLAVYVEPVVPAFLVAGDTIRLPVQVVNTSERPYEGTVTVDLTGATTSSFSGRVQIPAGSSRVLAVPLTATRAGELQVATRLGGADAVVRTLPVKPAGQRLEQVRSGTLAAPRSIELEGPRDMDPDSAHLRVVVQPGALAVLRRELARAGAPTGDPAKDAYALLLAGRAPALLEALGEPLDADGLAALRTLALQAGQRVMRDARSPDTATAALLLPAAAAHPDNPVLDRLCTRLADQLAREQRPDGTFLGGGGTTVQRMLVATAQATAAVGAAVQEGDDASAQRAARVRLSAGAAFERHQGQIADPYTAAAVLASGAVRGELQESLRAQVREAIEQQADGSRTLPVPAGVVRADGQAPSLTEATALAALALVDDPQAKALLPDLAATLIGSWRPGTGWADGQADMLASQAVATLLREPLPPHIEIVVARDGVEVQRGSLEGARRNELLVLDIPGGSARGLHTWTVSAEPAVPGLGFSLALQSWVPWPAPAADQGVQVDLDLPSMQVGHKADLTLAAAAPAHTALQIRQPLPAGVQADEDSLQALVSAGSLSSYTAEDGLLTLQVPPQDATTWSATFSVIPTLAGTLHADATQAALTARPDLVFAWPGPTWRVAP